MCYNRIVKNILIKEDMKMQLKGIYRFTLAKLSTPEHWMLNKQICQLRSEGREYIHLVRKLNNICPTVVIEGKNIVSTVGIAAIVDHLTNGTPSTSSLRVNFSALGTGTTTPAITDTTLDAEVYRRSIASATRASNVGYITAFYDPTEVSGTFFEHALFIDGSSVVDSGELISRVLISAPTGIVKTTSNTLTIDYTLTLN